MATRSLRRISDDELAEIRSQLARLLTVRQVAELLGVAPFSVYRLAARGEIPHVRVSNALRFEPHEVADFLQRQRRGSR